MNTRKSPTSTAVSAPMITVGGTEVSGFEVVSIRAAVVYGDRSRRVLHIHHAVTLGKSDEASEEETEARALKLAASELERRQIKVGETLKALAVDADALLAGVEYQVDKFGRKAVPVAPQRPRRIKTARKAPAASKRRTRNP